MPPRESVDDDDDGRDFMSYDSEFAPDTPTEEFPAASDELSDDELLGIRYDSSGTPLGPRKASPVADEPSALVARYLFPTEKFRGEWHKHWTYLFDQFAYAALATFVFGWLWGYLVKHHVTIGSTIVMILWVLAMAYVASRVTDWYYDRFILTNKRIMVVRGMVTRSVAMMPLLRVTDMKYEQSITGRLFNYGTFVLESAGQDQALRTVRHLPHPNELYLRIVEEMYEPEAVEAKLSAQNGADDGSGV